MNTKETIGFTQGTFSRTKKQKRKLFSKSVFYGSGFGMICKNYSAYPLVIFLSIYMQTRFNLLQELFLVPPCVW